MTGRLLCTCGAPMHGIGRINHSQPQRYCRRYGKSHPGRVRCLEPTVVADLAEATVWEQVRAVLADPEYLASVAGDHAGLIATHGGGDTDAITKADGEIHRLQQALTTTIVNLSAAGLDADTVAAASRNLQTKLSTAKAHRQTLADRHAQAASYAQQVQAVRDLAAVASTRLATATMEEGQDLYALLSIQIKIVDNRRGAPLRLALTGTLDHTEALNATESAHPQERAPYRSGSRAPA
ncbi:MULTISPECIES: hypothetical protein [unclassified Frankia]|uniref:hypothetical protein n=1 Tax=unclassified Frankia TaxID=2632575 RepID=UPI001EF75024|nr:MULTISPECIES: hypothetical protein [unclassified Frankia]